MSIQLLDTDQLKFSRTFHVPWSLGATNDDKVLKSMDHFEGKEVVITEKLDGENTTMNRVAIHARSLDSKGHWSRERVKQLYNEQIRWKLSMEDQYDEIHRICGENMQAKHSIHYTELEAWFYCFAIFSRSNVCYSWDDMKLLCSELGLKTAPLLWRGIFSWSAFVANNVQQHVYSKVSKLGGIQEGYVIRLADEFHYDDYGTSVAKFVRENHVTTGEHWMFNSSVENELKRESNGNHR